MKKSSNKKLVVLILLTTVLLSSSSKRMRNYEVEKLDDDSIPYASYNNGSIYIGSEDFLNKLANLHYNDILIEDSRKSSTDPNIIIYDSYKINDIELMEELINIIRMYDEEDLSDWNRTNMSMELEWITHNILYNLNLFKDHCKSVDLNNNDEYKYKLILFFFYFY